MARARVWVVLSVRVWRRSTGWPENTGPSAAVGQNDSRDISQVIFRRVRGVVG